MRNAEAKRAIRSGTQAAMKRRAEVLRCPKCARKSAMVRLRDAAGLVFAGADTARRGAEQGEWVMGDKRLRKGDRVRIVRAFDTEIYDVRRDIGRRGRIVRFDRSQPRLIVEFRPRRGKRRREAFWDGEVEKDPSHA